MSASPPSETTDRSVVSYAHRHTRGVRTACPGGRPPNRHFRTLFPAKNLVGSGNCVTDGWGVFFAPRKNDFVFLFCPLAALPDELGAIHPSAMESGRARP
jgi:hypothetical protein